MQGMTCHYSLLAILPLKLPPLVIPAQVPENTHLPLLGSNGDLLHL